jgi:hypothetical protein
MVDNDRNMVLREEVPRSLFNFESSAGRPAEHQSSSEEEGVERGVDVVR